MIKKVCYFSVQSIINQFQQFLTSPCDH